MKALLLSIALAGLMATPALAVCGECRNGLGEYYINCSHNGRFCTQACRPCGKQACLDKAKASAAAKKPAKITRQG